MPNEIGSGGEQVVATPAIKESLDAVQQAAFDECMRNRANQIPDELPVTTEAECLRFASQVDLTNESSSGDIGAKDVDITLKRCVEIHMKDGMSEEDATKECEFITGRTRDSQLKDQVIESHSEYMQKCQSEFGKSVEECEKLWKTYAGQISTAKVLGGDAKDQDSVKYETPTVGFKTDGKWEKHKDRPYTKKPKSVK